MLHLNSSRRLSMDIDIICPPGTAIEQYIRLYAEEYGFGEVTLVERKSRTNIPKQHAKFFYQVEYPANGKGQRDKILLDVLFEETHYAKVVSLPIESRFLKQDGEAINVNVPSHLDLLGDKLTAFAPHTTGVPFFKGEKNCAMEINKQLFDIASLFDLAEDLKITAETFRKFAEVELQYRGSNSNNVQTVIDDIFNTSLCIVMRGNVAKEEFNLLQGGISRIRSLIFSEVYSLDSAIVNASKAAYLAKLIEKEEQSIRHYNPNDISELAEEIITLPLPTKLNKLKKSNPEAFFYWVQIQKLS